MYIVRKSSFHALNAFFTRFLSEVSWHQLATRGLNFVIEFWSFLSAKTMVHFSPIFRCASMPFHKYVKGVRPDYAGHDKWWRVQQYLRFAWVSVNSRLRYSW